MDSLWRCVRCGREFANRNQSHACGTHDRAAHFRNKSPEIRALFDRVVALILTDTTDLDDEVRAWLAEAYAVGEQKHLGERRPTSTRETP
jgi:hypothetical protein